MTTRATVLDEIYNYVFAADDTYVHELGMWMETMAAILDGSYADKLKKNEVIVLTEDEQEDIRNEFQTQPESHEAVIECGKFTYDVTTKPTREVALCARVLLASRHQLLAEECPIENLRQDPSVGLLKDTLDAYIPLMSGFTHNKKTITGALASMRGKLKYQLSQLNEHSLHPLSALAAEATRKANVIIQQIGASTAGVRTSDAGSGDAGKVKTLKKRSASDVPGDEPTPKRPRTVGTPKSAAEASIDTSRSVLIDVGVAHAIKWTVPTIIVTPPPREVEVPVILLSTPPAELGSAQVVCKLAPALPMTRESYLRPGAQTRDWLCICVQSVMNAY